MLHDRRSGAEKQVEKFKMPQEVSRKVECLDSRGNAHSVQLIVRSLLEARRIAENRFAICGDKMVA